MIASNGAGKTTLLRILAGKDIPEKGKVVIRNGIKVGYLEQNPDFNQSISINRYIENSHSEIFTIIRNYKKAMRDQSENYTDETHGIFEAASNRMEQFHAWDYERKIKELLTDLALLILIRPLTRSLEVRRKGLPLPLYYWTNLIFFCWMSPPTTWILN